MGHTKFTAKLPTRTDLRETAARLRSLVSDSGLPSLVTASGERRPAFTATRLPNAVDEYVTGDLGVNVVIAIVAFATFAGGTAFLAFAVALALVTLPVYPFALSATAAVTTVALYALPLLALRAATRVVRATE